MDGTLPATLGSFSKLKVVNVARNRLSGRIPSELGNLTDLEELCVVDLSESDLIDQTCRPNTTLVVYAAASIKMNSTGSSRIHSASS